jgi:hypothetical protein
MDRVEALIASARRFRRRGDERRARQLLREACGLDEWRPRTFVILGAWLAEAHVRDEACQRFRHARWLNLRAGEHGRVRTLDVLLAAIGERAA